MKGTRFKKVLRESAGNLWRECKIAVTPVPKPQKWVFIVGCYNSGTTLLSELMGRHPQISAMPTEGHFITDQFVKDYEIGLPRMWVDRPDLFRLTEEDVGPDVLRLKKEWAIRLDLSKPVLLEKSPPNSARTRWFQKHFENAHFIGIVRNGYAVAEGISRKGDPQHIADGWPIERSAYQWHESNRVLDEDARHLKHFTWVKYEDLVAAPQETLNGLASFLGLDAFPNLESTESFKIHERDDALRDFNASSISKLTKDQIEKINLIAKDGLERFEYEVL